MPRSAALPFSLRRSQDVLGSAEMTTTTERVHGLLRLDGEKLVSVPWAVTPFGFWYNKELMKKAGIEASPKTWDEFSKYLEMVKETYAGQGIDAFELFTAKALYGVVHNWSLIWAFGAFPLENDKAGFDTPEMKNFFTSFYPGDRCLIPILFL